MSSDNDECLVLLELPDQLGQDAEDYMDEEDEALAQWLLQILAITGIQFTARQLPLDSLDRMAKKGRWLVIESESFDWIQLAHRIVKEGTNVNLFARYDGEYGTQARYALTQSGDRIGFVFEPEEEAETVDFNGNPISLYQTAKAWQALVPADLNELMPDFSSLDLGRLKLFDGEEE